MRMSGVSCLRQRRADGDHTHALVAEQSHSFPDNLVALLGKIRAWNCSAENASLAVAVKAANRAGPSALELALAAITTITAANRWIAESYLPARTAPFA